MQENNEMIHRFLRFNSETGKQKQSNQEPII